VQEHTISITGQFVTAYQAGWDVSLHIITDTNTATTGFQIGSPNIPGGAPWNGLIEATASMTIVCLNTF
jgi:hypothetical protein